MALFALRRHNFASHIVWECYSLIYQLASGNSVTLYWVPDHLVIHGNEVAHLVARNCSSIPFASPDPAIGIRSNLISEYHL